MSKTCQVCGSPSGKFPICIKCNELKNEGKVGKCPDCGKWKYTDTACECQNSDNMVNQNQECVVCSKPTNNGMLCFDCYKDKELEKKEFQKDRTAQEMKDHYFAQKKMLFRIKKTEYAKKGIIRLIGIAEELLLYHNDKYLKNRLEDDVATLHKYIIDKDKKEGKVEQENNVSNRHNFDDEDYRKQWVAEHQCDDGHYVRSYGEMLIDNWLYNNGYVHAYEKSVFMESNPDDVVLSDFYLPELKVYLEYWGMDDEKYIERRKYKESLYQKNKLNLISLEKDDVKRINDILPRKLHEFKR